MRKDFSMGNPTYKELDQMPLRDFYQHIMNEELSLRASHSQHPFNDHWNTDVKEITQGVQALEKHITKLFNIKRINKTLKDKLLTQILNVQDCLKEEYTQLYDFFTAISKSDEEPKLKEYIDIHESKVSSEYHGKLARFNYDHENVYMYGVIKFFTKKKKEHFAIFNKDTDELIAFYNLADFGTTIRIFK